MHPSYKYKVHFFNFYVIINTTKGGVNVFNFFRWIYERLDFLQRNDPLTDLPDRNALKKINKKRFENRVVSVVFFDLDNLKQINDYFGHQLGDIVLKEFADLLKREIRNKDLAVRWGGDEFLVCLFDVDKKEAGKFLKRIKIKTDKLDITRREDFLKLQKIFPEKFSSTKKIAEKLNNLGVSGGISEVEKDLYKAICVADNNMYEDKDRGKDFSEFEVKVIKPLPEEEKKELKNLLRKTIDTEPKKVIKKVEEEGFVIAKRI